MGRKVEYDYRGDPVHSDSNADHGLDLCVGLVSVWDVDTVVALLDWDFFMNPKHPVDETMACFYHGLIAGLLIIGVVFHGISAWRHYGDISRE